MLKNYFFLLSMLKTVVLNNIFKEIHFFNSLKIESSKVQQPFFLKTI